MVCLQEQLVSTGLAQHCHMLLQVRGAEVCRQRGLLLPCQAAWQHVTHATAAVQDFSPRHYVTALCADLPWLCCDVAICADPPWPCCAVVKQPLC